MTSGAVSEAVAKAEAQLATFWAAAKDDESGRTSARAATMNFVAVTVPAEVENTRGAVEELAGTRAGRTFIVTLDGRLAPWDVESEVSAVCHKEGDTVVCYDRIELAFGAMASARAASVVSALSLSEVPTIVELGKGAPIPLADALLKIADRVIVDSQRSGVLRVADAAKKTKAPLGDRAFVRTFSWRELVARFFDEVPAAARAVGRVEIERTTSDKGDPAALLLGWLASRLGWRFESATRAVDAAGMPVDITVRAPSRVELSGGEIAAVRMVTAADNRPLFCSCERRDSERVVRWSLSGPRSASHDHALGFRDEGWVLRKTIDSTEGDSVYRDAVIAAAEWIKLHEEGR